MRYLKANCLKRSVEIKIFKIAHAVFTYFSRLSTTDRNLMSKVQEKWELKVMHSTITAAPKEFIVQMIIIIKKKKKAQYDWH